MVEHHVANVDVAGSSPVARFCFFDSVSPHVISADAAEDAARSSCGVAVDESVFERAASSGPVAISRVPPG